MLKVTVELWPQGRSDDAQTLGVALIVNDGTGDEALGNYEAVFNNAGPAGPAEITRSVFLRGFDRRRDAWNLLHEALAALLASSEDGAPT